MAMRKDAHFNEKSRRKRFLWYERKRVSLKGRD